MSEKTSIKRSGKLESAIMSMLSGEGKALYSQQISWALYNAGRSQEIWERPTRSFDVSVRRAIHRLAANGALLCENTLSPSWIQIGNARVKPRLLCWLSGQRPADIRPAISGREIEEHILCILEDFQGGDRELVDSTYELYISFRASEIHKRQAGDMPYRYLLRQLASHLDAFHRSGAVETWLTTAASRAVDRLAWAGKLQKHEFPESGRVFAVRLSSESRSSRGAKRQIT